MRFDENNSYNTELPHSAGVHNLEVEIEGLQAVIRFVSSFTLRMTEPQIDELRQILYETSRHMALVCPVVEVEQVNFNSAEDCFIDEGIKAREALKASRRTKQQSIDIWDPNDPSNW